MHQSGISTKNLVSTQSALKVSIASSNAELSNQQRKLAALTAQQERTAAARQRRDKLQSTASTLAVAGAGATATGAAMAAPVGMGIKEAKHYQLESARVTALGLGKNASADAVKFARDLKTYGTSKTENLELVRDAMSIFGDLHHAEMVAPTMAKMKFANNAFFGEEKGHENVSKFMDMMKVIELRGGTGSVEAFDGQANMVQKVISATGGRVGPSEWLNFLKTGGIAAKIMDDKSFYYQMEPLVQEVGGHRAGTALMSGYSNLYQGRTTKRAAQNLDSLGLIGDPTKVQHDKVGQVATLGPGALLGSDIFRRSQFEWMETVLLPQLAKKGITDPKQIEDTIGGLFSNRTAGNQFLDFYRQRKQIHKNAKLNEGAYDIDQINELGKSQASGKELEATAKMADLKLALGEKILPMYSAALDATTSAIKQLNQFMEANPTTAKVMIVTLGLLAGSLLILGPLMLGIAALLGPFAVLRFMMTAIGLQGGILSNVLKGLTATVRFLGTALAWVLRALLMNPIGLAITGIALAAMLIYTYWEPIKGFFTVLWADVNAAFNGGILGVSTLILNWSPVGLFYQAFAAVLGWFGIELPGKFTEFGAMMLRGLADGITGALGFVKSAIVGAADSAIGWFKEKLGIKSPSRVFAELGDFTMQGLTVGLERGQDGPLAQVTGMARQLAAIGAGIAITGAAAPAIAFDTRPPLAAAGAPAASVAPNSITINIHPTPGMDAQAIAQAVAAELDRRERERATARRSRYVDYE